MLFIRVLNACMCGKCLATTADAAAINLTNEPFTREACMSAPERRFHLLLFLAFVSFVRSAKATAGIQPHFRYCCVYFIPLHSTP